MQPAGYCKEKAPVTPRVYPSVGEELGGRGVCLESSFVEIEKMSMSVRTGRHRFKPSSRGFKAQRWPAALLATIVVDWMNVIECFDKLYLRLRCL